MSAPSFVRDLAGRFIGGEDLAEVVSKAERFADDGFSIAIAPIDLSRDQLSGLIARIRLARLTDVVELSLRMSTLGETPRSRRSAVHAIAEEAAPMNVILEAEGSIDEELSVVMDNLTAFPGLGLTIAANQRRSEADCKEFAKTTARVRLVKGAFPSKSAMAYSNGPELDKAYVRCLKVLMAGTCRPMIATHDDRLLEIASALAARNGRKQGSYEFDFYVGVANKLAERIVERGDDVRLYLPYGEGWSNFLLSRLAVRPANVGLLVKGLTGR